MHGLGSDIFCQYYNPIGIQPQHAALDCGIQPMPNNISKDSIQRLIIDNVGNNIKSVTFSESELCEGLEIINSQVSTIKKDKVINRIANQTEDKIKGEEDGRNI